MAEKQKYQLEFLIKSSASVLYSRLGNPSGLAEWFADDVNIKDDLYSFFWDGAEEQARLIGKKSQEFIKFQWLDDEGTDCYFEFRIRTDALTKEVALIITDYAEDSDRDSATQLWQSQVNNLMHILGS